MKVIVTSSDAEINNAISHNLSSIQGIVISFIETTDDFIEALILDDYDVIISDYLFDGIDIWQLTKLINSKQLVKHALPVYLISETCSTEIPPILANAHHFRLTTLKELSKALHSLESLQCKRGQIRASIIVIEDDEDASDIVCEALKGDYDVDKAPNGEQGLALWKEKRHDLILLDYMLPGLKGDEVLSEVMEIDENQPIIVLTAFDRPEYNKEFLLNGAGQYLRKPYSLTDLRAQCISLLSKSTLLHQDRYYHQKQTKIKELVTKLELALRSGCNTDVWRIIDDIKANLPSDLSDDEQSKLWESVSLL